MKKYYIITYGCQMNKSDSERIATILEKKEYRPALNIEEADLILVNMCSVRQSAVDRIYGLAPKFKALKKKNPKLKTILTGCFLKEDKQKLKKIFDAIIEKNNKLFSTKPKREKNSVAFVPISNGCNNFCSYCVVPFTRGRLFCREAQEILKETKKAIKNGYSEIWLLGQNVNDYKSKITQISTQKNIEVNFAKLIKMINDIPGDFKFFFTSPHPKNFSDELIDVLSKCEKFGKILNLPVQSGDNEILKKMNRNYTAQEYKTLVKKIRKNIPDIKLSTDVIVGFPGETKKQFENTVKLFKELKFNWAYIAKYSPRAQTASYKMKDNVSLKEKRRREKMLRTLIKKQNE
ncbi:MAG: MiaB/RimO family radical SAM methylthiotransferase [Candidatus Pacebacteria bacterium]|nr:MiaB/RimO family radical SAM methylthiotransferase [Candidatus Paceibacterota bacterium]